MAKPKKIYIRLLIIAIAIYVIGSALMLTDIYVRVCRIEHASVHSPCGH